MNPYWLFIIVPVALAIGGQLTSIFEYKKKYNLTDEELDLLRNLYGKATGAEQNLLSKIKSWL